VSYQRTHKNRTHIRARRVGFQREHIRACRTHIYACVSGSVDLGVNREEKQHKQLQALT
jgi:hypothetical protein